MGWGLGTSGEWALVAWGLRPRRPTLSWQVQSLLQQSTPWKKRSDVSLPSELLGSRWDSQAPAWVLLEECGLKLQVDAPEACWAPEALSCTCALYACLALLLRLQQLC